MMRSPCARVLGLVLIVVLSGCADKGMKLASKEAELMERVEAYHDMFYWRDYETASLLVVSDHRSDFMNFTEQLKTGYAIESYTIKEVKAAPDGSKASVVVSRSFVRAPSITLQSRDFIQEWVADQDGVWFLSGPPY